MEDTFVIFQPSLLSTSRREYLPGKALSFYYIFHSRVWHTICYSPKMVYFTAQECEENEERKGRTNF